MKHHDRKALYCDANTAGKPPPVALHELHLSALGRADLIPFFTHCGPWRNVCFQPVRTLALDDAGSPNLTGRTIKAACRRQIGGSPQSGHGGRYRPHIC
jgi:hypothetical protein